MFCHPTDLFTFMSIYFVMCGDQKYVEVSVSFYIIVDRDVHDF